MHSAKKVLTLTTPTFSIGPVEHFIVESSYDYCQLYDNKGDIFLLLYVIMFIVIMNLALNINVCKAEKITGYM